MASNVYTKNEILQNLASKGYFIDVYTLDTFFQKWKIESIFEDEQGSEFYDKNVLDIVLNNLFSAKNTQEIQTETETVRELKPIAKEEPKQIPPPMPPQIPPPMPQQIPPVMPAMPAQYGYQQPYMNIPPVMPAMPAQYGYQQPIQQNIPNNQNIQNKQNVQQKNNRIDITDSKTAEILRDISLSDGTPLIDKVQDLPSFEELNDLKLDDINVETTNTTPEKQEKPKEQRMSILAGAMELSGQTFTPTQDNSNNNSDAQSESEGDFDDISLLSESLEAQEKFKEYVISELQRKNADFNPNNLPQGNEFKLDISERTISMIARTMAKKIAKNINNIFSAEAKNTAEVEGIREEYKKLEQRTKELEEQNKKLRLLLSENKKYMSSFKPSIFGLYKKVTPNDKDKK